ncbi:MAG TPA: hypothetical protein VMN78_03330 [Longimicrobiales bacterium]|nr:hypothetical protein [Longimicrobiales bacterium]
MEPVLYILAAAGISAVLLRLIRALFRLVQRSGEAWIAAEAARARAGRGDLTGLDEALSLEQRTRTARTRSIARTVAWVLVLLVPPFTPWALELYAACSLLWLTRGRVRRGTLVPTENRESR